MDRNELREMILERIERPKIPNRDYSVLDFGVLSASSEIQTFCFQTAIDAVSSYGGGVLHVPAGTYRTGALQLKNCVELHLDSKKTLIQFVNEDQDQHYPVVFSHWEATPCMNYSPLIYAYGVHDIAVTGLGTLDGGADEDHWWNWHHQVENAWSENRPDLQRADRNLLRNMNLNGTPVNERVYGPGHFLRPNFIQLIQSNRILLEGFTLKNSPMWQLNPVMCESIIVEDVTMSSHGPNNDGCDPESCKGVLIRNCRFDTGDDCISLKSGRDRDGREANCPCEYVLIQNNDFADGHGGVALGSEMSGGVRCVLAEHNRFRSPNLTYALRLKTNARRGGIVENIILADSIMDHVHGAAVHGTMLYEDGRNGYDLPAFRNITVENVIAHGGDYGIFLEAFDEVPITGLVLKNIQIDGAAQCLRSMNWLNPIVEDVSINGKTFPRPGKVRILGVPKSGAVLKVSAECLGGNEACAFLWELMDESHVWKEAGFGETLVVPKGWKAVRVTSSLTVNSSSGLAEQRKERSREYRILSHGSEISELYGRLRCRGFLAENEFNAADMEDESRFITRSELAKMLIPFVEPNPKVQDKLWQSSGCFCIERMIRDGLLAALEEGSLHPELFISRQEMATVAMQACGVNYRNASSTMPDCADVENVSYNYGTNVARALYFGFMTLDSDQCFHPLRSLTKLEACQIVDQVANFAGI